MFNNYVATFYLRLRLTQMAIEKRTATKQATRIAPPTAIIIHVHIGNAASPLGASVVVVKLKI